MKIRIQRIDFEEIKMDKCSSWLGIYFDDGEITQLVQENKLDFLSRLSSIFKD